jgi:hypothetical protein
LLSISEAEFDSLINRLGVDSSAEFFDKAKRQQFFDELSDEEEFFEALPTSAFESKDTHGQNDASAPSNFQNPKTNIKFVCKIKFGSTQAAADMKKEIKEALTKTKSNTDEVRPLTDRNSLRHHHHRAVICTSPDITQELPDMNKKPDKVPLKDSAPLPTPTPAPVLLGATPKLAPPAEVKNKEKLDDSTPKKAM